MAVLNNGLQLTGTGSDMVQIIKGLFLLAAVALDVYNKNQGRFSVIEALTRPFRSDPPGPGLVSLTEGDPQDRTTTTAS